MKKKIKKNQNKKIHTFLIIIMILFSSISFYSVIKSSKVSNSFINNENKQNSSFSNKTKSVLWTVGSGLEGEITTKILIGDLDNDNKKDSILLGTTNAVWLINSKDGEVLIKYKTLAYVSSISFIEDKDNDGLNDIIISTLSQKEPNIILLSSKKGNVIWQFEPIAEVFTENQGFTKKETRTWCVSILENVKGEENVLTSSWRTIYLLNGKTGNKIWSFEGNDDIWTCSQIKDITNDQNIEVIAGSQDGDVYLLDGVTGKEIWHKDLTKSYKLRNGAPEEASEIDLNVWNVLEIEDIDDNGYNDIVVTSENGYVYLLNGNSGEEIWNYKAIELKKVEREVGFGNFDFFNLRAQIVGDLDGNSKDDIVVFKKVEQDMEMSFVKTESSEIIVLSSSDEISKENRQIFEIKSNEAQDLSTVEYIYGNSDVTNDGKNDLVIPINGKFQGSQIRILLPMKKDNFTNTLFDFPYEEFSQVNFINDSLMILGSENGVMLVDIVSKKILWDKLCYKNLEIRDFSDVNNDGFSDLLFIEYLSSVRNIRVIDRKTGKQLWDYSISLNTLLNRSLNDITIIPDVTNDDISDIIGYIQNIEYFGEYDEYEYKEYTANSEVFLINGKTGKIVWNVPPTPYEYYMDWRKNDWDKINKKINSIDYINDIDGDNINDIILGGKEMSIYFLSGKNGSLIEHYSQRFPDENDKSPTIKFKAFENDNWKYLWTSSLDGKLYEGFDNEFDKSLSIGEHGITLLVTDKDNPNNCDMQIFTITTFPPGTPHWNVNINGNWTWEDDNSVATLVNENLTFKPDGYSYLIFDFGDGEIVENVSQWIFNGYIEHEYTIPDQYLIKITNRFGYIPNETRIQKIIVRDNDQPIAEIGINDTENFKSNNNSLYNAVVGENIEFQSNSKPLAKYEGKEEYINNFSWDFGDDSCSYKENPKYIYNKTGLYKVKLLVNNSKGKNDTDEMIIKVRNATQPIASLQEPNLNDLNKHFEGIGKSFGKHIHDIPYNLQITILRNKNKEDRILISGDGNSKLFSMDLKDKYWESERLFILKLIDDLNDDGYIEIASMRGVEEYYIVSGQSGEILLDNIIFEEMDYEYILENLNDFLEDFNGDGKKDIICYKQIDRPLICAYDSLTNRELWRFEEIEERNWDNIPPMILIDDLNGDNTRDVAVATQRTDEEKGGDIRILDGKTGNKINTLVIEKQKNFEEWIRVMALGIRKINDISGDLKYDFAVVRNTEDGTELDFINSNSGTIIRSFPVNKANILNNIDINNDKKSDLLLATDYNVYCLNSAFEIKILEPKSGKLNNDEFILKWDKTDIECEIFVDDISYGFFVGGEKKLKLSIGKHEIIVKIYDEFDGSVLDKINIEIPDKIIIKIINYCALAAVIAIVTIKIVFPKIKKKRRKKEMDSRIRKKQLKENNKGDSLE